MTLTHCCQCIISIRLSTSSLSSTETLPGHQHLLIPFPCIIWYVFFVSVHMVYVFKRWCCLEHGLSPSKHRHWSFSCPVHCSVCTYSNTSVGFPTLDKEIQWTESNPTYVSCHQYKQHLPGRDRPHDPEMETHPTVAFP